MNQIFEACRDCGSRHLEWQKNPGWLLRPISYLRCRRCGDCLRVHVPMWAWALYAVAAMLVIGTWMALHPS